MSIYKTGMIELNVYNQNGEIVGKRRLPSEIFEIKPNDVVIYEAVCMYQANKRQGTASTKTRAEVSGGGRKPWPQKHTGRARAGSIRSPLWRHGGVVFGPKPRDWHYWIPKKKRRLALFSALSYKAKAGKIILVDKIEISEPRTKTFKKIMENLGLYEDGKKKLFLFDRWDDNVRKSGRNIEGVMFGLVPGINALDVLLADTVVFTLPALDKLEEVYCARPEGHNTGTDNN